MEKLEIRATAAPWNNGVNLLIRDGEYFGVNVRMERKEEGIMLDPTVKLSVTAAQTLIDDLWQAGLRPTEGSGSAGSLRATENHLQDMRKIAFKQLDL